MRGLLPPIVLLAASACAVPSADDQPDADAPREAADSDGDDAADRPDDAGDSGCSVDRDCDDRIACTVDHCTGGSCAHEPCVDCCREGLTCIPGRGCDVAPTPCTTDDECRDDVRCTIDRCRDATFCEHLPQDGLCEPDEICLAGPGCVLRPPDHCTRDDECIVGPACAGLWECETEFGCQFVGVLDCDDGDDCTADSCDDAVGCVNGPLDADGDTHADAACDGDDCDDEDPAVYPGADEACNGVDDDCDDVTDEGCCEEGSPCTTPCGTTGTRACNPDGTVGPCAPPGETCNGADDDCDSATDEDFECPLAASAPCTAACGSTGSRTCDPTCSFGECVPPSEVCNGADDDCDGSADQTFPCALGTSSSCTTMCGSTGARLCLPGCTPDAVCTPPSEVCNGADDDCDGTRDDGFACCVGCSTDCDRIGFFAGTADCAADCSGWDASTCTNCGNAIVDAGEDCDTTNLGGHGCTTIPGRWDGGTLGCTPLCTWDTSRCTRCGNGVRETGEQCDGSDLGGARCDTIPGGYTGGTLRCSSGCLFDTSGCTRPFDPTGIYVVTPPIFQNCAFGIVNFTISTFDFSDSGAVLVVTGAPCPMTGPSARLTRSFTVSCTLFGDCDETYSLSGTFDTDDHWNGTFTAAYSGTCFDCSLRTWPVGGQR